MNATRASQCASAGGALFAVVAGSVAVLVAAGALAGFGTWAWMTAFGQPEPAPVVERSVWALVLLMPGIVPVAALVAAFNQARRRGDGVGLAAWAALIWTLAAFILAPIVMVFTVFVWASMFGN